MRPVPIEEVPPGLQQAVSRIIAGPSGDLTDTDIAPVEALVTSDPLGGFRFYIRIALEPGDLELLHDEGGFWLMLLGRGLQPFALTFEP